MPLVPVFPIADARPTPGQTRRRGVPLRFAALRDPGGEAGAGAEAAVAYLHPRRRLADDGPAGHEVIGPRNRALLLDPHVVLLRQIVAASEGGAMALAHPGLSIDAGRLTGQVAAVLENAGLPARRLEVVLPEAALIDMETDGLLALSALRDLGVSLCIDAFGTGVASLTLLRRLPLTRLKLARGLVRAGPEDREDAAILHAIIATAHAVGLIVVGDGIETERQRAILAHSGCDEGQGPLFGPPLRAAMLPRQGVLA